MATMTDAVSRLARALQKAADEHGRPNTFACAELATYGGPPVMVAGRIGNSFDLRAKLHAALGGSAKWGSAPTYAGGRWAV